MPAAREALDRISARLGCATEVDEKAKVSLVGVGLLNRPDCTARLLAVLARLGTTASWVSSTNLRVSVIIPLDRVPDAVNALHQEFGLGRDDLEAQTLVTA